MCLVHTVGIQSISAEWKDELMYGKKALALSEMGGLVDLAKKS